MTRFAKSGQAVVLSLALALTAAGCGGGGSENPESPTAQQSGDFPMGGTLKHLDVSDFEHLDPQRNYVSNALNAGRLIYRTLTTFPSKPGEEGNKIVPDMATDLGTPSEGGKVWTFTLKDNLKYEDGTPIVAADIKYGVERSFSDQLPEGPQYAKQYLEGGADYKGPYVDDKGLASIETPDENGRLSYCVIVSFALGTGEKVGSVTAWLKSPMGRASVNLMVFSYGVSIEARPLSST